MNFEIYRHLDTRAAGSFKICICVLELLGFSTTGMHWICAEQSASGAMSTGLLPSNNKSDFDSLIGHGTAPAGTLGE